MIVEPLNLRPYDPAADTAALAGIAALATGEPYSSERVLYDLTIPGIDPRRDIAVCECADGRIGGYAVLSINDVSGVRQGRLECRVPPDVPDWTRLSRALLLWAARRMQEELDTTAAPTVLVEMVKDEDLPRREFLEDAGFRAIRFYRIMRLDNPAATVELPPPPGYSYIHGPGAQAAAEYVAMFNDTWVDHYGFTPLTIEYFLHDIESDPDYDPSLDIVLVHPDGRFAGFSFCRIEPQDDTLGEVLAIGIRRGHRGAGLGRILLTHSIRALTERGVAAVELTVDSENPTGAERLYESVGFRVVSMKRRYRLEADGIIRLATLDLC